MKILYRALFQGDMEQTRVSNRVYSHAWRVRVIDECFSEYGFAGSEQLAKSAASSCAFKYQRIDLKCDVEIVTVSMKAVINKKVAA